MQETDFILQNKDKWKEFEDVLKSTNKDPERLTDLFIETTDDLSFSRTYYPNRSVRVYLNGISQQVYQAIYRNKEREKNVFRKFWIEDLPEAMWHSRKALLWSFLLFAMGVTIGIVSSIYYPEFAKIILGDGYISMTEANIASGDPMAVYKGEEPLIMFFHIAWNNIRIAFGTFVLGILFGIGTVYVVFYNAIMVGTFIYFFIERGLFKESFLAIMLHGTLELSMIVVAGCAGFALARGLLFPGTYTRGQALIHSSRNGIKILIGVTVLLIYAAIIESFATRYTEMPDIVRVTIILLSLLIVLGYFVFYPRYRYRKGHIPELTIEETPGTKGTPFNLTIIKSAGTIFTETFELFARNVRLIATLSLAFSIVITIAYGFFTHGQYHEIFNDGENNSLLLGFLYPWDLYNHHINFERYPMCYFLLTILFSLYAIAIFKKTSSDVNAPINIKAINDFLNILFISLIAALPLLFPHVVTFIVMPFFFPICLLWIYVTLKERKFFLSTIGITFKLMVGNFWRMIATFLSTFIVQWIFMFLLSSQLVGLLVEFITMNIPRNATLAQEASLIIYTFLLFFIPIFIFSLSLFGTALLFFSIKEVNEATTLISAIEKIGFKKRAYGLEQE